MTVCVKSKTTTKITIIGLIHDRKHLELIIYEALMSEHSFHCVSPDLY
jgi:hypothetical protein